MTGQQTTTDLDLEALRRGIRRNDALLLAGLYADDARLSIVNRRNPPSRPFVLVGGGAIAEYLRAVHGRGTEHRVLEIVAGGGRLAFMTCCEYRDGSRVLAASIAEVRDGKIAREVSVEAWDE